MLELLGLGVGVAVAVGLGVGEGNSISLFAVVTAGFFSSGSSCFDRIQAQDLHALGGDASFFWFIWREICSVPQPHDALWIG